MVPPSGDVQLHEETHDECHLTSCKSCKVSLRPQRIFLQKYKPVETSAYLAFCRLIARHCLAAETSVELKSQQGRQVTKKYMYDLYV